LSRRLAVAAATALIMLACAPGAPAQAPPAGLGEQLFSTGGEITVEVLGPVTAGLTSELRLYNADDTFVTIATNRDIGTRVVLPPRPAGEELVFGIFVRGPDDVFKMGPGDRNPDGLAHAKVAQTGERQFDVGFEDLFDGGDRDYDDNIFRFSGGLAPNRTPVADDQALTMAQGGSLPITLTASDPDGDPLTFAVLDGPRHGVLTGAGTALTYTPAADFSGTDTFGFTATDGASAPDEGRVTIGVVPPPGTPTTGASVDCPFGELTLLNVLRTGRRVRLTGLAESGLAGAPVSISEGAVVVARTAIRPDGTFAVRVRVPARRGGRVLRYRAAIGRLGSRNVRLRRRMVTRTARVVRGRVVLKGRVVADAPRHGRRPLVVLSARPRGCKTRSTRIGRARLHGDGTFRVSGRPLPGGDVSIYRARVRLRRGLVTYTLPQGVARR
jgi:hypothetical protein